MKELEKNSIDLIYLDPPFNSKRNYNLMYKNMTGEVVPEQVEAFCDMWEMDDEKQNLLDNMVVTMNHYKMDANFVQLWDMWIKALRETRRDLTAYLLYMTVRLLEMKRILKTEGSIYLHCDSSASHYLKVLMDGIFGHENFRNEIIWERDAAGRGAKKNSNQFPRNTDYILFYSKTKLFNFRQSFTKKLEHKQLKEFRYSDEDGRKFKIVRLGDYTQKSILEMESKNLIHITSKGTKYKKSYLDEFKLAIGSIWNDIPNLSHGKNKNYLGYPTQKPTKLLDRIIKASCPENGVMLDPFCGCGTSIYSAHSNNRKWIGIDIAILSTRLVQKTLQKRYDIQEGTNYKITGIPVSIEEAKYLWKQDAFQFQNWCIEYVRGFCTNKKTRDGGIDGRLYFKDKDNKLEFMVISVKGGKLKATDVRDLVGTMEKEKAVFGGLICFDKPSKDMIDTVVKLGKYKDIHGVEYNRLQFISIEEMIVNKKLFHIPNNINRKDYKKDKQERLYI